jgi:hypothetical protein
MWGEVFPLRWPGFSGWINLITFAQAWAVENNVRLSDQAPKRLQRYAA